MHEPDDASSPDALEPRPERAPSPLHDMPVVARMVVEVRSDGVRTMARGALEDLSTGQQVAIETPALTPVELSLALSRSLLALPGLGLARSTVRALLPRRLRAGLRRLAGRPDEPSS